MAFFLSLALLQNFSFYGSHAGLASFFALFFTCMHGLVCCKDVACIGARIWGYAYCDAGLDGDGELVLVEPRYGGPLY